MTTADKKGKTFCVDDISMRIKLAKDVTLAYEEDGDWDVGQIVEQPNALSQGRTLQELQENIKEAYELVRQHSAVNSVKPRRVTKAHP